MADTARAGVEVRAKAVNGGYILIARCRACGAVSNRMERQSQAERWVCPRCASQDEGGGST